MSLTQAENIFASMNENGMNDVLAAFFRDRPRYLVFGSPAFVPVTTAHATAIAPIAFPGVPGGIEWQVRLSVPHIDLFPQTVPPPPGQGLDEGMFSITLDAELCIICARPELAPGLDEAGNAARPRQAHPCVELSVYAVGTLERVSVDGADAVALSIVDIAILGIAPKALENFVECLLLSVLQGALSQVRVPLRALRAGAFQLVLTVGPLIEDNSIKVRGFV